MIKVLRLNLEDMRQHGLLVDRGYNLKQNQESKRTAWLLAYSQPLFNLHKAIANSPMQEATDNTVTITAPVDTVLQIGALLEQYKLFFGDLPND